MGSGCVRFAVNRHYDAAVVAQRLMDESALRTELRHQSRRHVRPALGRLELSPSPGCVVGFARVPDLRHALRQAKAQKLTIDYVYRDINGRPWHAVILWRGKPVIVTDAYDGTEIH